MAESPGGIPPECSDDAARSGQRGEPRKLGLMLLLALFLSLGAIAIALGIPAHRRWHALQALEQHEVKVTLTPESEWITQRFGDWATGFRRVTRIEVRDLSDEVCMHIATLQETTELYCRSHGDSQPLTSRGMRSLHSLRQLEHFTAWGTGFSDELLAELFSSSPPLRGVTLHGTGIGQHGIEALSQIATIEYLNLPHLNWYGESNPCCLLDDDFIGLPELPRLQHLNLSNCQVDAHCLNWAAQSPELRTLILNGSSISDAGLSELTSLAHLETLDISDCRSVTDAGLVSLVELPSLSELRLSPHLITEQTLDVLKQSTSLREVYGGSMMQALGESIRIVHFPSMEDEYSFPPIRASRIDPVFSPPTTIHDRDIQGWLVSEEELIEIIRLETLRSVP